MEKIIIKDIVLPGSWLDHYSDSELNQKVYVLINGLIGAFDEANTSLNLFNEDNENFSQDKLIREIEIQRKVRKDVVEKYRNCDLANKEILIEKEVRSNLADLNIYPNRFLMTKQFLHARMFLFSLDNFKKILQKIISISPDFPQLIKILEEFDNQFPHVIGVRNSAHHLEDRLQAESHGKAINLKPINNNLVSAPQGGVLVLNSLRGKNYGNSMANGEYGEVEVSEKSLERLKDLLQRILNSYNWRGPTQLH